MDIASGKYSFWCGAMGLAAMTPRIWRRRYAEAERSLRWTTNSLRLLKKEGLHTVSIERPIMIVASQVIIRVFP